MGGAPATDFRAAYDEIHALFMSRRGVGERVYDPGGRAQTDWARRAILARIPAGSMVLDIGGGEGELAALLAGAGNRVACVDVSSVIIARAEALLAQAPGLAVRFQQADARELPFADGGFDYVVSEDLLEHLPPGDLGRHLAEVHRVLGRGCYIASTPSRLAVGRRSVGFHLRMYSLGELHQEMRRAGLRMTWMDPRVLRRLGRRVEVGGSALWGVSALEWALEHLGMARWPARWRQRLAPKPLVCGYPA